MGTYKIIVGSAVVYGLSILISCAIMGSIKWDKVPKTTRAFLQFCPILNTLFLTILFIKNMLKSIKDFVDIILFDKYLKK
jgi:hypothetical protein